ncbi:MAG TPA: DUF5939 domain-containing protein [Bacillales bacterium]|nr:DUF5939 domain-containing protein [Bacillales bacterium]
MKRPAKTYKIEQEIPLPRKKVWDLLANTDHLNRLIGLFPIQYSLPQDNESLIYREIRAKVAGMIPLEWREYPFVWTKFRYYAVERVYTSGPLKRFYGGVELEDAATILPNGEHATAVRLFADFTPANVLGIAAIPLVGKRSMKKTMDYCESYLKLSSTTGGKGDLPQPSFNTKANTGTLEERIIKLRGLTINSKAVDLLHHFIVHGGDEEVANMRPYELAARWNVEKDELLRLFLYATKEGVLNLSWELMCPNCRVSKVRISSLQDLNPDFHCDLCGVEYEANFDRYVELRFRVAPAVRKSTRSVYCIGGPFLTPHVLSQFHVKPGVMADFEFPYFQDDVRLRVVGSNDILSLTDKAESSRSVSLQTNGWALDAISRPEPGSRLQIENQREKTVIVVLEKIEWDEKAVTAAKVTTMHEFRDLFSSEVLSPGEEIQIENTTLLFSDLKGSTELYEIVGDAHAYSNVRRHFDYLSEWITHHSGSIVKTIGDAVMAVFYKPEDAVKAAYDIHAKLEEFNTALPEREQITVKMGLHHGPAIVVNSNDRIDYFGRTVNIAARIQGKSDGEGFVLSDELFRQREVTAFLREKKVHTEIFQTELKGIGEKTELVQVVL